MQTTLIRSYAAKLYYSTAGVTSPTWVELKGVQNVTINKTFAEDDATVRGMGGVKISEPTLVEWSLEFDFPYDATDADQAAFSTAANTRASLGIAVMSGPVLTSGSKGFQGDMKVFTDTRDENIDKILGKKFTLKPCLSATAPAEVTIS